MNPWDRSTPPDLVLGAGEYLCKKCNGTGYQLGITAGGFAHYTDICTNCRGVGKVKIVSEVRRG